MTEEDRIQQRNRLIVTIIIIVMTGPIILSDSYSEGTTRWACGIIGAVTGYWLS